MNQRGPAPIVRHSFAQDPNPEKVEAALDLWRRALAKRMAESGPSLSGAISRPHPPHLSGPTPPRLPDPEASLPPGVP